MLGEKPQQVQRRRSSAAKAFQLCWFVGYRMERRRVFLARSTARPHRSSPDAG